MKAKLKLLCGPAAADETVDAMHALCAQHGITEEQVDECNAWMGRFGAGGIPSFKAGGNFCEWYAKVRPLVTTLPAALTLFAQFLQPIRSVVVFVQGAVAGLDMFCSAPEPVPPTPTPTPVPAVGGGTVLPPARPAH